MHLRPWVQEKGSMQPHCSLAKTCRWALDSQAAVAHT